MDWWGLSKTDKGGIITILLLSLLIYSYRYYAKYFFPAEDIDATKLYRAKAQFDSLQAYDSLSQYVKQQSNFEESESEEGEKAVVDSFFGKPININTASIHQLINLELDSNLANRVIKFRYTIGRYNNWPDLQKVYGIKKSQKQFFLNRIYFGQNDTIVSEKNMKSAEKMSGESRQIESHEEIEFKEEIPTVELNTATYEQLLKLKGIGDYYAKSIIENREKLGGYYSLNQLLEIFKLDTVVLRKISIYFIIDTTQINRLSINKATTDELYPHPYITYKQAKQIVNYRTQHGLFLKPTDLLKIHSLSNEWLQKIMPYLSFESN